MPYRRFLTDKDYLSLVTEEHMNQLTREVHERLVQAEQRAEMNLLEYLDQYYEIEKLLAIGKNIAEYSPAISYPANVYFRKDEEIFKTLTAINGYKKPTLIVYWRQVIEFVDPRLIEKAQKYSQLRTYAKGDIVKFGTEYWICETPHGFAANEIHIPGCNYWKAVKVVPWEPNMDWEQHCVVSYDDMFYTLTAESDSDATISPSENDSWSLIGDYSLDYEYDNSDGAFDYVVAEGAVFLPVLSPNTTALVDGVNIAKDDPRNINIVGHMSRIALYYLHQLISPTNISETRRWAFEDSMNWLMAASKFRINPQLPRKREHENGEPKVDWALATYQKEFNPNENPWLI